MTLLFCRSKSPICLPGRLGIRKAVEARFMSAIVSDCVLGLLQTAYTAVIAVIL